MALKWTIGIAAANTGDDDDDDDNGNNNSNDGNYEGERGFFTPIQRALLKISTDGMQ